MVLLLYARWSDSETTREKSRNRQRGRFSPCRPVIVASGDRRRTGPSPTRSGLEGSSRNEFRPGSSVRSPASTRCINERFGDRVSRPRPQISAFDLRRADRAGADGAHALGRYRVYIIDEVHMLSRNAFNALLKTLEEPPPHAKFVFATTEIQKVPLTVLSRCQRFSLRRVPVEMLAEHYRRIAEAEAVEAEPAALALIARASDGSVRDGLSLLDQAIALTDGRVTEEAVRVMLGVAGRGLVFELLESVLRGDAPEALARMD